MADIFAACHLYEPAERTAAGVDMMYKDVRFVIVRVCEWLVSHDMVAGSAGNVSVRSGDHVIITPTNKRYTTMSPNDLVVVDMSGNVIEGGRGPSSEMPLHLEIYRNRSDVCAIIHTHSIYASTLAVLRRGLPPVIDEITPRLGGDIRVSEYAMPGTRDLAKAVVSAIENRSAALIANHGAVACGKTLEEALDNAVLLERASKIYLLALRVGEPVPLPAEVIREESEVWRARRAQ